VDVLLSPLAGLGREDLAMTAASRPQAVRLRSGDVVRLRQVRPGDAAALGRAYAKLGEQSRYRRFFTLIPELSQSVLQGATDVDHEDHEALVAVPLLSGEIVGECRFFRLADRRDTADMAVTVADAWQNRGLGSALLRRLSLRALEVGIAYFSVEVLAENRTMLAMLPSLGRVETDPQGSVVGARIEIADPPPQARQELLNLVAAVAGGEIVCVPAPLRRLIRVPDEFTSCCCL
jgi:GNAT superfamily N-acetyltransferase